MDKKTRTIIIIGGILTFIVVPVAAMLIFSQMNNPADETADQIKPPVAERTNEELAEAIATDQPQLLADESGQPNFVISDVKKPQTGWYIVTMHFKYDTEGSNPAKILLFDQGESLGLKVLIGPGTSFTNQETDPLGIPDAITKELNK